MRSWLLAAAALGLAAGAYGGSRQRLAKGVEELRRLHSGHRPAARPAETDEVFLEYIRALDAWHAHGSGMDALYRAYEKAAARWNETATRLHGPGAGWTPAKGAR